MSMLEHMSGKGGYTPGLASAIHELNRVLRNKAGYEQEKTAVNFTFTGKQGAAFVHDASCTQMLLKQTDMLRLEQINTHIAMCHNDGGCVVLSWVDQTGKQHDSMLRNGAMFQEVAEGSMLFKAQSVSSTCAVSEVRLLTLCCVYESRAASISENYSETDFEFASPEALCGECAYVCPQKPGYFFWFDATSAQYIAVEASSADITRKNPHCESVSLPFEMVNNGDTIRRITVSELISNQNGFGDYRWGSNGDAIDLSDACVHALSGCVAQVGAVVQQDSGDRFVITNDANALTLYPSISSTNGTSYSYSGEDIQFITPLDPGYDLNVASLGSVVEIAPGAGITGHISVSRCWSGAKVGAGEILPCK